MGDLVVVEADLRQVAVVLERAGTDLLDVADRRRSLVFAGAVGAAVEEFLTAWELVLWGDGQELAELGRDAASAVDLFEAAERWVYGRAPWS